MDNAISRSTSKEGSMPWQNSEQTFDRVGHAQDGRFNHNNMASAENYNGDVLKGNNINNQFTWIQTVIAGCR